MADPTLKIAPSADQRSAVLEFATDGKARQTIVSVRELDEMIRNLAAAREALDPPVPMTPNGVPMPLLGRIQAILPAERIDGRRIIGVRHPGFGWIAFELLGADSADLASGLINGLRSDRDAGKLWLEPTRD